MHICGERGGEQVKALAMAQSSEGSARAIGGGGDRGCLQVAGGGGGVGGLAACIQSVLTRDVLPEMIPPVPAPRGGPMLFAKEQNLPQNRTKEQKVRGVQDFSKQLILCPRVHLMIELRFIASVGPFV